MSPEDLAGVETVVHLAYDRKAAIELNVEGVKRVFNAAKEAGASRQIFVSSYSARPDALSEYGRLKYLLESFFLECGQTIVRPGLVIGNGGLFGRNMEKILHTPLMPFAGFRQRPSSRSGVGGPSECDDHVAPPGTPAHTTCSTRN